MFSRRPDNAWPCAHSRQPDNGPAFLWRSVMSVALAPWYLPMRPVPKPADPTKLAHCSAPSHCLHFAPAAAALVMGGSLFLIPKEDMAFVRMGIAARSASSVVRALVATYGLVGLLDLLTGYALYAVSPLAGTGIAAAAGQRLGVGTTQLPKLGSSPQSAPG